MNELREILKEINARIEKLDKDDPTGHIYWNMFRELVEGKIKSSLK